MPTYIGTLYSFKYDLGEAGKRGITKKFHELKREIRSSLGKGVEGLKKRQSLDRIVARFEILLTDREQTLEKDYRALSKELYKSKIPKLEEIKGLVEKTETKIYYHT